MRSIKTILPILFLLSAYCSFAQPAKTIHKMDSLYQLCLDKGQDMAGCSYKYYDQMDSMLHVVYKMARVRLDTSVRVKLNKGQLDWVAKRDEYFKTLTTKNYGTGGNDREMMMEDDKATYVRKRVMELLKRLTY
jgi:uncharacterized protein YecT (DUF1311 family)